MRNNQTAFPGWHPTTKAGGAADTIDVENDDADNLGKTESDDRQVITAQAQARNADYQTGNRCDECAKNNYS